MIRQSNPLPPFYQARSRLTLEESGLAKETTMASDFAMVAASNEDVGASFVPSHMGQEKGQQQFGRKQTKQSRKIQVAAEMVEASKTRVALVVGRQWWLARSSAAGFELGVGSVS
ncbi:hypothetical protein Syun_024365 [Stephania yunnanensis]|uniref:Uncharacterized protein n=1 Tax=Stephania yunnanensis TaxID=152371 RepID=A0AAP0NIK4_9MAGN